MTNLAVIGTGYVGLVTGACLASRGHKVNCFDKSAEIIDTLRNGLCPIHEDGLKVLLTENTNNLDFLHLTSRSQSALRDADAIILAVGTPTIEGSVDLSQIERVCETVGSELKKTDRFISVIVKSTVTPGTTDTLVREALCRSSGKALGEFGLGMNPEFLREGSAVLDFLEPDRIVFGYEDERSLELLKEIYSSWDCPKLEMNARSAEMTKYVNNALLATLISTSNEYANIARKIGGIDFGSVLRGVELDGRWSPRLSNEDSIRPKILDYLRPGCGYGGSCFPKDVSALRSLSISNDIVPNILTAVIDVNEKQPGLIVDDLESSVDTLEGKNVTLLGLAFKPNTDDVRESVSLKLIEILLDKGASVVAHDPVAMENAKAVTGVMDGLTFESDWIASAEAADIVLLATAWEIYSELPRLSISLEGKIIYDARQFWSAEDFPHTRYKSLE